MLYSSREVEFTKWTVDGKLAELKCVMVNLSVQSKATVAST